MSCFAVLGPGSKSVFQGPELAEKRIFARSKIERKLVSPRFRPTSNGRKGGTKDRGVPSAHAPTTTLGF